MLKQSQPTIQPDPRPARGVTFRRFRGPQDYAAMSRLINLSYAADGIPEASTAEGLAHYYSNPEHDPTREVLLVEINGEAVAYSRVYWVEQPAEDGGLIRLYRSSTFIHPEWRSQGFERAVLAFNSGRIRQLAQEQPSRLPAYAEINLPSTQVSTASVLDTCGYRVVRHYFVMSRPLAGELPAAGFPANMELREVEAEHLRLVWDAIEESFLDHWGSTPHSEEDYRTWMNHPDLDPSLWVVAWDGDQVAGAAVNFVFQGEDATLGRRTAWVEPLFVRRPWRRQGLAKALLIHSLHVMQARGLDAAALEVDTENPNQALHLYESCGFQTDQRWDLYRKQLAFGEEDGC